MALRLDLRELMAGSCGWGREAGWDVHGRLMRALEGSRESVVLLSLRGVERCDVSFAAEVVDAARRFRGRARWGVALEGLTDSDLSRNFAAAASEAAQPLIHWGESGDYTVLGPQPIPPHAKLFDLAMTRGVLTSRLGADATGRRINLTSMYLRALWQRGFVLRRRSVAAAGFLEYRYSRIGPGRRSKTKTKKGSKR